MNGVIKSFLSDKGYGFIKGEDGKDYFFHISDITNFFDNITDGLPATFNTAATPKGYKAKNITMTSLSELLYEVPTSVILVKESSIRGWEILEQLDEFIFASSEHSPEDARRQLAEIAKEFKISGITQLTYFKTKASSGNYIFTIHNFKGLPVSLARKSLQGQLQKQDIPSFIPRLRAYQKNVELELQVKRRTQRILCACFLLFCTTFILVLYYLLS